MEAEALQRMRAVEGEHWWFVGRRAILADTLSRIGLPRSARILEAGCGPGGNLAMLSMFGDVSAIEPDAESASYARERGTAEIRIGRMPGDLPFERGSFDLVAVLDVLEHLPDDRAGLVALRQMLKPKGMLLATVPAFRLLWSEHDRRHHHYRRYTRPMLIEAATKAGFEVLRASYFNTALFPLIAAIRVVRNLLGAPGGNDEAMPPSFVNALLRRLFAAERIALRRFDLPVGVSILMIGRNP